MVFLYHENDMLFIRHIKQQINKYISEHFQSLISDKPLLSKCDFEIYVLKAKKI